MRDAFRIPEEITQQLTPMDLDAKVMNPGLTLEDFIMKELRHYPDTRDQYAEDRTSRMSSHLNVGAISARAVYSRLIEENGLGRNGCGNWPGGISICIRRGWTGISSIMRRSMICLLWGTQHFEAWSQGRTGVPVIDAAMRQLNATGWMPNRLRMITAMFLTKNLGLSVHLRRTLFPAQAKRLRQCPRTVAAGCGALRSASMPLPISG